LFAIPVQFDVRVMPRQMRTTQWRMEFWECCLKCNAQFDLARGIITYLNQSTILSHHEILLILLTLHLNSCPSARNSPDCSDVYIIQIDARVQNFLRSYLRTIVTVPATGRIIISTTGRTISTTGRRSISPRRRRVISAT
jgi:hypothetical protein